MDQILASSGSKPIPMVQTAQYRMNHKIFSKLCGNQGGKMVGHLIHCGKRSLEALLKQ